MISFGKREIYQDRSSPTIVMQLIFACLIVAVMSPEYVMGKVKIEVPPTALLSTTEDIVWMRLSQ